MMMETAIPFGGFYESIHSRRLGDLLLTQYGCDNPEHDKDSCSDDTCTSKATDEEYRAARAVAGGRPRPIPPSPPPGAPRPG